jgi:Glycosyl transferase family 11
MITVRLLGGLGNQMFQRAYGIALESKGYQVAYDRTHLVEGTHREYSLDGFDSEISLRSNMGLSSIPFGNQVYEVGMRYQERYTTPIDNALMIGYWQSEQYFKNVIPKVLKAFSKFTTPLSRQAEMYKRIIGYTDDSAFIHVRRQDYVALQHVHGMPSLDYYNNALEEINPTQVFIFSDDPGWCFRNFKSTYNVVHGTTKFEDLQLMRACRHAVIANSSFSWWGAWLGDCQMPRTVIAPKQWFNPAAGIDDTDIVPERWRKV